MKNLFILVIVSASFALVKSQSIECSGNLITIALNGFKYGNTQWQFSTNKQNWNDLPGKTNTTLQYNITETGYFRAKVTSGQCEYYSDTTYITVASPPTNAMAGQDQVKTNGDTMVNLSANIPVIGRGKWSIISGTGGIIANDTLSNTTFQGRSCSEYILRWTISGCTSRSDDVLVAFKEEPTTPDAGPDLTVTTIDTVVTISGNSPVIGNGMWSVMTTMGGNITNEHMPVTTFQGYTCGAYKLRWTISAKCSEKSDDMNILFRPAPTKADAGTDIILENTDSITTLTANIPVKGTGRWSVIKGSEGSIANPLNPFTAFTGIRNTDYWLTWTISTDCSQSTDTMRVVFLNGNHIMDLDWNIYKTVTIGTQEWMAENLKTTKFSDTSSIFLATGESVWSNLDSPGYCWYNNNEAANKNIYGALYNWETVNAGNLCPIDWHVPSDDEWTLLLNYLGTDAGNKLLEAGAAHWDNPHSTATNEYGFTALPGGYREPAATFLGLRIGAYWWSSTEYDSSASWLRCIGTYMIRDNADKRNGFSVRCIRD